MRRLLHHLCACLAQGQTVVMGTIVESSGSAPRSSGARMLLCRDGRPFGTIGGESPAEIALSIIAEIQQFRYGKAA